MRYFLGEEPETIEEEQKKDQLKGEAFTRRMADFLGGQAKPDPSFSSELMEIDQEGRPLIHKSTGLVQPMEKPEQQPKGGGAGDLGVMSPFGGQGMDIQQERRTGTAFDPELKTTLKIDRVAGNVAPTLDPVTDEPVFEPMELEEEPTDLENFINRVARGIPEHTLSFMKGLNTTFDMINQVAQSTGLFERIDPQTGGVIVDENFLEQSQQFNAVLDASLTPLLDSYLPTKDDGAFYSDLASGIGSGLFFLAGGVTGVGLLGKGGKIATRIIPSMLGAGTMSQQMYEDAVNSGASEEDAIINYLSGGLLGATEGILGIGGLMSKVGKRTGKSIIRDIMEGAGEEWFQETFQTLGQNLTVQETYDLSRDIMDGVGRSGAVALITGGLFSGGVSAVNRLMQKENLTEDEQVLLQQARNNFNQVANTFKEGIGSITVEQQQDIPNRYRGILGEIVDAHNKAGGSSYSAGGKVTQGYSVGTQKGSGEIIQGKKITVDQLNKFIQENEELLKNPNNFIGTWYDKETNTTHLDISTAVETEEEAQELGRANDQKAVWDFKNNEEIEVLPLDMIELKNKQLDIPPQYQLPVFHYSDMQDRGFITDPQKIGQHSYTKGDVRHSTLPRTFFYTDPRQAKRDHFAIRQKTPFIGSVDMRRVYDLSKNEMKYGFEKFQMEDQFDDEGRYAGIGQGQFSIDEALNEAKADGWEGVRYNLAGGQVVNMFKPVYVERTDAVPSVGELLTGKWDSAVADAKKRLNSGFYGSHLMDATGIPVMGARFVADIGTIMADKLIKTKTPFGTPQEFAQRLVDEFGDAYPIVKRFARQIYEYAKKIRDEIKKSPLSQSDIHEGIKGVHQNLMEGKTGEYIPTGKGVVILGGDILDFQGKNRKALGVGFARDHALLAVKENPKIRVKAVAYMDKETGEIFEGKPNQIHADLLETIDNTGRYRDVYSNLKNFEDGFIGSDGQFYTRSQVKQQQIGSGESITSGVVGGYSSKQAQEKFQGKQKSFPIWATQKGVAKQIADNAVLHGNDTIVFMAYPNAWNSLKPNYIFQENLNKKIQAEIGEAPKLPDLEVWKKDKTAREKYFIELGDALKKVKEGKTREEQSVWSQDKLAYEFGIENGENLVGKIIGVAKFLQVNEGKDRKSPHKLYDAEIEGYNYIELNEPIDFNFVKEETAGTDVAVQGKIKDMQGKKREQARRNNLYRNLQQRGLAISEGQSKLVDALILASEGDTTLINQWLQENDNTQGEIYDVDKHNQWLNDPKRQKENQELMEQANRSLSEFLSPQQIVGDVTRKHTPAQGGLTLYSDPFFVMSTWKGLQVIGKATLRGVKGFAKWSQKMVEQLGEWIKPALRSLYKLINQLPNFFKPVKNQELAYRQTEEGLVDPNENKEEAKQKRIMGDLPSITKGYNMDREHPLLSGVMDTMLETMRTEFDVRRRGTISNEDLKKEAKRRAESLTDDDIWNLQQGDIRNAEDIVAMRIYVADKVFKVLDEMKKLNKGSEAFTIKEMSSELVEALRMYEVVRAVGTELGRGVQSFNIPITDDLISGMNNAMDVINSLDPDNKFGGQEVKEAINDITKLDKDTPAKKQTAWEWIRYIFLNWILQNPLTDTANIFGNLSNLSFHATANIDQFARHGILLRGLKKGFKEGGKNALKILHGEMEAISKFTENSPIDVPKSKQRSWKNYFRLLVPTTRLGIEDSFFRALGRNLEMERMSYKVGKDMGISPDIVARQVSEIINNPDLEKFTRKEYKDMATYLEKIEDELVFQNELGQIGKGFQKISRVAFPIIPFVTTPANIVKFGVSATPFGLLKLVGKKDLTTEEKNQIIRRAIAGSVFMSGLAGLISQGLIEITGGGSEDAYERDLMEKLGYKPYHLYINTPFGTFGGSYMNVNPMNTALAVVGDLFDKYRFNKFNENPAEDLAWYNKVAQDLSTALLAIGSSVTDQSYLSGVRDLMDALAGRNPDWFMRTLTGYARMGGIQGIQRITGTEDRGRYVTKGRAEEQIQKNNPFFSNEGLIKSIGAFGDQRQSQYERFPLPITKTKEGTAYNWLKDNGLRLTIPSRGTKVGNRELTRKEYEMHTEYVGKKMDEAINALYEHQTDPELDPEKKLSLEELQEKLDKHYDKVRKDSVEKIKKLIYEKYKLQEGQQ